MSYYPPPGGYPGYPPQGYPQQPYGYPPAGYPPSGYPGYPPQGQGPPPGYPPQGQGPPPGYPPQGQGPTQGYPPQGQGPPQGYPPQGQPPPEGQQPPEGSHSREAHVAPPPPAPIPALVSLLGPQFVLPYETTLVLKDTFSFSSDDMDIMDIRGMLQFRLRAKLVSLHKKRAIYDNAGNAICSTMQKVLTMKANTSICTGAEPHEQNKVAEVKKVVLSFSPQAQVFFKGNKSSIPDVTVQGNFSERSFRIVNRAGQMLAEVTRDIFSVASIVADLNTYYLRIFPGVDTALMVVLVTIIEEMFVEVRREEGYL